MWRLLMAGVALIAAFGVDVYLLSGEKLAPTAEGAKHIIVRQDPLIDLTYTSATREATFRKLGLDDAQVKSTLRLTNDLEDKHTARIQQLLLKAPDPEELADVLCGQADQVRTRYGALRFLVEEKKGLRTPIDLNRVTSLSVQEWALTSTIPFIFADIELADERPENATLMALAGILANKEALVLEHKAPWGRSLLPGSWSWDRVKSENPGIEDRTLRYLALMHLTAELARAEGGICNF